MHCLQNGYPSQLRYKTLRKASSYGAAVAKLFSGIRSQYMRSDPKRQAFLRLLKEIIDFVNHQRGQKSAPLT